MSRPQRRPANIGPDGKRIKFYPLEIAGKFVQSRRFFGWAIILAMLIIPWVQWNGLPIAQINPDYRRLSLLGHFWYPTDINLIVTAIIAGVIALVALTARYGRVWCGWACPQTVFLHWIAEPIERLIVGKAIIRKRKDENGAPDMPLRRGVYYTVMFGVSVLLGHSFLTYFAGTERVFFEYWKDPGAYPVTSFFAFLFSMGFFVDLVIIKEIFCTVICPYARLQGVLVDTQTLQVRYKEERGEPRVQKKSAGEVFGDCTNCDLCHKVCPTGIDIRDGYQLECIGCARCADACDQVMTRAGKEKGLVSYNRMQEIKGIHWRTVVYLSIISILLAITAYRLSGRGDFKLDWVRNGSDPFIVQGDTVINTYKIRLRSTIPEDQIIYVYPSQNLKHSMEAIPIPLKGGVETSFPIVLKVAKDKFKRGKTEISLDVGKEGDVKSRSIHFVGPW